MTISAALVKELRERSGAGLMDCKKVLTETGGDIDAAMELLRKKGAAQAEKKAGRIAAEGAVVNKVSVNGAVTLEINCETDFVAKDEGFVVFCQHVADAALANTPADVAALNDTALASGDTVEAARQALITKIGENINVRRFQVIAGAEGEIGSYIHHGSKIGVLVKLDKALPEVAYDIAMHVAASNPLCISEDQVSDEVLQKEREIYTAQAAESGKPAEIIEKMVEGRMGKFLKENTLLGQPFFKDPDQTVGQLLQKQGATIVEMVRYEVGEGIEKKEDDFVAEVMAQAKG